MSLVTSAALAPTVLPWEHSRGYLVTPKSARWSAVPVRMVPVTYTKPPRTVADSPRSDETSLAAVASLGCPRDFHSTSPSESVFQ